MSTLIKRLPTRVSYRDDILLYGQDNLYPQRVEQVVQRSPITNSAIEVTSDFLDGKGFEYNGEAMLGDDFTANELLDQSGRDFAMYRSVAFILDVNMLGDIVEVTHVDFHNVRLGAPTKSGKIKTAKVSVDWEEDLPVQLRPKILTYPLWKDKEHALGVIEDWDYETHGEFPGFLLYHTPKKNTYPLSTVDPVLDSSQTNAEIQIFELAGVQNGFLGATLLKHPGKITTEEERTRMNNLVASIKGTENANSVIVWEIPDGYDSDVLEQFPANNQDTLFDNTNKTSVNRIIQSLAIPPSLLGIMPENSFFSLQEIEEAYRYFNVRTNNRRATLARIFNDIGKDFITPINFGMIVAQQYVDTPSAKPIGTTLTLGQ